MFDLNQPHWQAADRAVRPLIIEFWNFFCAYARHGCFYKADNSSRQSWLNQPKLSVRFLTQKQITH